MKNKFGIVILGLGFLASPAFADWTHPVSYMETIFKCNGTTPDLSKAWAVNISIQPFGKGGEYRLQDRENKEDTLISVMENQVFFQATKNSAPVQIGTLKNEPTCTFEDAGEEAHPSWNAVSFTPGTSVELTYSSDPSACEWDAENDGFTRTRHYAFSVKSAGTQGTEVKWDDQGHYSSPEACRISE